MLLLWNTSTLPNLQTWDMSKQQKRDYQGFRDCLNGNSSLPLASGLFSLEDGADSWGILVSTGSNHFVEFQYAVLDTFQLVLKTRSCFLKFPLPLIALLHLYLWLHGESKIQIKWLLFIQSMILSRIETNIESLRTSECYRDCTEPKIGCMFGHIYR